MKTITLALVCLSLSNFAFANHEESGPCKKIKEACEAAGYTKGGHKKDNKGLYVDCMKKLADGQPVQGVSVSADEIAACKEKAAAHRAKKSARNERKRENVKAPEPAKE